MVYIYTDDIDIAPVIQDIPDWSRNTLVTNSSTNTSADFFSYSENCSLPTFNIELLDK